MYLIIDVGNSNITAGLADENKIEKVFRLESNKDFSVEEYKNIFAKLFEGVKVDGGIIASVVVELNDTIKLAIDSVFSINSVFLNELDIGIKIVTPNPKEAGADRIANAYAAKELYGYPTIVVDAGTATTFDIIDGNGDFSGGIIMPGINTQLKSLCEKTSLLPDLQPEGIDKTIGSDTKTSILSGVIRGHAAGIDGLLEDCKHELGIDNIKVIGTGGNIELISKYMKQKFNYIDSQLTLEGTRMIYELNGMP